MPQRRAQKITFSTGVTSTSGDRFAEPGETARASNTTGDGAGGASGGSAALAAACRESGDGLHGGGSGEDPSASSVAESSSISTTLGLDCGLLPASAAAGGGVGGTFGSADAAGSQQSRDWPSAPAVYPRRRLRSSCSAAAKPDRRAGAGADVESSAAST